MQRAWQACFVIMELSLLQTISISLRILANWEGGIEHELPLLIQKYIDSGQIELIGRKIPSG